MPTKTQTFFFAKKIPAEWFLLSLSKKTLDFKRRKQPRGRFEADEEVLYRQWSPWRFGAEPALEEMSFFWELQK